MLRHFHASLHKEGHRLTVYGGMDLQGNDLNIPGDISSAAFWLVAASALPGSQLSITNVGLNPTRTGVLNVLMRMGANLTEQIAADGVEPYGTILVHEGTRLRGTDIQGDEIPNVIDELPILAVAGAIAEGITRIKDAKELRVKETDRIAAVAKNLRAFGVHVEEKPDGMEIQGCKELKPASVPSYGDHRIAMAFSILGMFCKERCRIEDTACIATSYPGFEEQYDAIVNQAPQNLKTPNVIGRN
jgi:3-phosphoshikimate 1-carboxyvinyltransferase